MGEVYRSTDKGNTWEFKHDYGSQTGKNLIPSGHRISDVVLSTADPRLVFFIGNKGLNWVSEDCGSTLRSFNSQRKIQGFKFHPTKREWALASLYTT